MSTHVIENRGLLHITGEDTRHFLQGLLTNDIEKLSPEKSLYAAMLTPQGKFLYDFFLYDWQGGIVLEYFKPKAEEILQKLNFYKLRAKIQLQLMDNLWMVVAQWGNNLTGLKDPRHESLGLRFITDKKPSGEFSTAEEYNAHRISLTIPEMPGDLISGESFPLPSNFEEIHAIDFQKGCYVGQEVTARSKYRGSIRKKIYTVTFEGSAPPAWTSITRDGKIVGTMLSHSASVGLAQLESEFAKPGILLQAGSTKLSVK